MSSLGPSTQPNTYHGNGERLQIEQWGVYSELMIHCLLFSPPACFLEEPGLLSLPLITGPRQSPAGCPSGGSDRVWGITRFTLKVRWGSWLLTHSHNAPHQHRATRPPLSDWRCWVLMLVLACGLTEQPASRCVSKSVWIAQGRAAFLEVLLPLIISPASHYYY